MSVPIESAIWTAIRQRIETLPDTYPIAWPGEVFSVPHGANSLLPFLRVGTVSAQPSRRFIANGKAYDRAGFVMLTLVYPLGQPLDAYNALAGRIAAHFNDAVMMRYAGVCVSVPEYPHVQDGYEENGYWETPIRVPWRCSA